MVKLQNQLVLLPNRCLIFVAVSRQNETFIKVKGLCHFQGLSYSIALIRSKNYLSHAFIR